MQFDKLFQPTAIAVIGVSHEPKKVGHLVARNIIDQGFAGNLYFINKTPQRLLGKTPYTSLADVPGPVDVALLAIPADAALAYMPELAAKQVPAAVLYASGFKEIGPEGAAKEKQLQTQAKAHGITILGPNCLGFINTRLKINATFLKHVCPSGNIGFISQSGALGSVIVDYFVAHKHLGLSYFISLGNKTVFDESDALEFLLLDPQTQVIALYLEDVKDGARFQEVLRRCSGVKPVIILKSGATAAGSQAAASHTGGLVGDDQVFAAVCRQCGAIRAQNVTQLLTLLKLFSYQRLPHTDTVLVLSNAGGAGVLLADELIQNKLQLLTISEATKAAVAKAIGEMKHISLHNPIDLLGDASAFDYKQAIAGTIAEKSLGAVIILLTPQANTQTAETARAVATAQSHFNNPIYPIFMGEKSVEGSRAFFEERKVASFSTFDQLPRALAQILWYQQYLRHEQAPPQYSLQTLTFMSNEHKIQDIVQRSAGKAFLSLPDTIAVFTACGLPVEPLPLVTNPDELRQQAKQLGFPLVAKTAAADVTHKTEANGITTDIKSDDELFEIFKRFNNRCYLQKQRRGYEILVGAKRDAHFGPVVVVGLGGVYAELLRETTQLVFPFNFTAFSAAVESTKLQKFVSGFRGLPLLNVQTLFDMCVKIGLLLQRIPAIKEVDINPLMVGEEGLSIIDGRIIL